MTDVESPDYYELLREARQEALEGVDLPDACQILEPRPASVAILAPEWPRCALLGQCINITGDGPDLDEQGKPRWSWAVGVRASGSIRLDGVFVTDPAAALRELETRLPPSRRQTDPADQSTSTGIFHAFVHRSKKMPSGRFEETGRYWRSERNDVVAECRHVPSGEIIYFAIGLRAFYPTAAGAKRALRHSAAEIRRGPLSWTETTERGRPRDLKEIP